MKKWYRRWMLKRIILALKIAVEDHGLKPEVLSFAGALEATNAMSGGAKKDTQITLTTTKQELAVFISYMIQLHSAKLSLLTRARIGLVALLIDDKKLMPNEQDPLDFAQEQFDMATPSKDGRRIQLINK